MITSNQPALSSTQRSSLYKVLGLMLQGVERAARDVIMEGYYRRRQQAKRRRAKRVAL